MASWVTISFTIFLSIDLLFVVLVCCACSFRLDQLNRLDIHPSNQTVVIVNSSNYDPVHNYNSSTKAIFEQLYSIAAVYRFIAFTSIMRVLIGLTILLNSNRNDSLRQIVCSSLLTLFNILLCITLTVIYHEDFSDDLDKDLDRDLIGDKKHSIEFIIGLVGIPINLSSMVITCGYDSFRAVEVQETARLRAEAINRELRRIRRIRRNRVHNQTDDGVRDRDNQEIDHNDNNSEQQLITN